MTEQEVKLKGVIADYLEGNLLSRGFRVTVGEATDNIYRLFEQAGYVLLDEDQSLPENPYNDSEGDYKTSAGVFWDCVHATQQDMLKENFKKIRRE